MFVDYWICDECKSEPPHYGICYKCGICGRKFDSNGNCINIDEYPPGEEE